MPSNNNNNNEEVKEPDATDGEKKSKIKLVHKVYENEDKTFKVYGLCCTIL
jgi:hypothetical protein